MTETMPEYRYYDFKRHWSKKVKQHVPACLPTLEKDFSLYLKGWRNELSAIGGNAEGLEWRAGAVPRDYESIDSVLIRRAPVPDYAKYVKHGACHWVVNFYYDLACLAEPNTDWLILETPQHSTVIDLEKKVFLGISFYHLKIPIPALLDMVFDMEEELVFNHGHISVGVMSWQR